jgi:hypothetical protein
MANISESDLKKNLENRFNCNKSLKKTIIQNIEINLTDGRDRGIVRIPAEGYLDGTPLKKIEEEIKQLEEKLKLANAKDIYIYKGYRYIEVYYSYYKGKIEFKTFDTNKGSLKIDVKITPEQIEAIKSLVSQNVLKTCENQINNFQKIFKEEINQEQVKSAVSKSFIGKITDKLQLK